MIFVSPLQNQNMPTTTSKQKSQQVDFEKEYSDIIKQALEFTKFDNKGYYQPFYTQEPFKKFSLYSDCPNSITSFNTDAVL